MLIFGFVIIVIILWGNGVVGIDNNDELINQVTTLTSQIGEKDLLIFKYKKEILDWTLKYKNLEEMYEFTKYSFVNLEETYELTKHSLNMANEALNSLNLDQINDSDDYE